MCAVVALGKALTFRSHLAHRRTRLSVDGDDCVGLCCVVQPRAFFGIQYVGSIEMPRTYHSDGQEVIHRSWLNAVTVLKCASHVGEAAIHSPCWGG